MSNHKRYESISNAAQKLLTEGESARVDFKALPNGVSVKDLVSFANTDVGGTILVGVEEKRGAKGEQVGNIVGSDISDSTILQIKDKALHCIPPICIEVHIENLNTNPFLRVEIPASQTKPHCTREGVYCRRDGNRNAPLQPTELLGIFLDKEAQAFAEKFQAAADRITHDLDYLEQCLTQSIESMADKLGWSERKLDDTESMFHSTVSYALSAKEETEYISTRLRALFAQDGRHDPVRNPIRKQLLKDLVAQLSNDDALLESVVRGDTGQGSIVGRAAVELDKGEIGEVIDEAVKIVQSQSSSNQTE